ncbi:hypothetical protein [Nocardia goodfellowii]|uniref:Uncharacterized protein n=1 Tax=Nocardia goodfellowii TaxID=882446 RepID=A0ABS4Q8R2_9NOCA|nr:hypothetical protein [Nocardia goodfellowii]MBP2188074.1 hypothetical protein [Nocardia goodfellowii]
MSSTLTDQNKATLRTAAYGAISLLAAASGSPHKAATAGTAALYSATGTVGHVLAAKSKDIKLDGKTVAELADQVLPALTESMHLLGALDPAEAENFRSTIVTAIDAATAKVEPSPTTTQITGKITAALDA